jgi:hypothetical protein
VFRGSQEKRSEVLSIGPPGLCRPLNCQCGAWIVADMRELSLGRRFDGILAWDSFFHLDHDDQRRMFPVFAAHASGGAWLMFNAGPRHGEAIGNYRGDPLYHASLSPGEYETLIKRCGFKVIEHAADDERAGGRTAWLCRSREGA